MSPARAIALLLALTVAGSPAAAAAEGAPADTAAPERPHYRYALTPQPVTEGVWLVRGSTEHFNLANGGNIANSVILIGDEGVVLVDTGPSLAYGEALRAAVATLTPLPVVALFLSHHHPDHFLGNGAFGDVPIYALQGTHDAVAEQGEAFLDNLYRLLGPWMKGTELVPPNRVLTPGRMSVAGIDLEVYAFNGHTRADLALVDRRTDTLLCGDLCFHHRAPTTPNANIPRWRATLAQLEALGAARIIPGHGDPSPDFAPLEAMEAYLVWLDEMVTDAVHAGDDMAEVMFRPLPERFDGGFDTLEEEYQRSVMHLFPPVERRFFRDGE